MDRSMFQCCKGVTAVERRGYGGGRYGGDRVGGSGRVLGLSLGTEYGVLVFGKGSGKNWWPACGSGALSLDDRRLFLLGFFAAEPPLLFTLELMVEKVKSLLIRLR